MFYFIFILNSILVTIIALENLSTYVVSMYTINSALRFFTSKILWV